MDVYTGSHIGMKSCVYIASIVDMDSVALIEESIYTVLWTRIGVLYTQLFRHE
jgi:hypothetical protein